MVQANFPNHESSGAEYLLVHLRLQPKFLFPYKSCLHNIQNFKDACSDKESRDKAKFWSLSCTSVSSPGYTSVGIDAEEG